MLWQLIENQKVRIKIRVKVKVGTNLNRIPKERDCKLKSKMKK